ncbi:hypothetical protein [Flavobacterium sp. N1994]|uniref:hypothetical protein n=1 Tax=Flavobacterium sp. N1994 TaxID=2986827 RepID=UPI002222ADB7|nr:hypothetical protein [Flavobacterium sp. N1994]
MKIKRNYIDVAQYRSLITQQINRLLDYLLQNDDYEQDLKLKAEIKELRQKHKLCGELGYARITCQIEMDEVVLESKMNETQTILKLQLT